MLNPGAQIHAAIAVRVMIPSPLVKQSTRLLSTGNYACRRVLGLENTKIGSVLVNSPQKISISHRSVTAMGTALGCGLQKSNFSSFSWKTFHERVSHKIANEPANDPATKAASGVGESMQLPPQHQVLHPGESPSHCFVPPELPDSPFANYTEYMTAIMHELKDSFVNPPWDSIWHLQKIQDALGYFHYDIGMPWWMAISALTICTRLLLLPLNISLVRNSARLRAIREDLQEPCAVVNDPKATPDDQLTAAQKIMELHNQIKANPRRHIIMPFLMAPVFLSVFASWERILMFNPDLRTGGCLWYTDLTAADPSWTLPCLSGLTWIGTVKAGADRAHSDGAKKFESFLVYLSLCLIPVTANMPQGMFLYWITSNLFTLCFLVFTRNQMVRRWLRIPPLAKGVPFWK